MYAVTGSVTLVGYKCQCKVEAKLCNVYWVMYKQAKSAVKLEVNTRTIHFNDQISFCVGHAGNQHHENTSQLF